MSAIIKLPIGIQDFEIPCRTDGRKFVKIGVAFNLERVTETGWIIETPE